MLTPEQRKERLPFGAQARVAEKCGVDPAVVNRVVAGTEHNRRVKVALARLMVPRTTTGEAFGPQPKVLHKMGRSKAGAA